MTLNVSISSIEWYFFSRYGRKVEFSRLFSIECRKGFEDSFFKENFMISNFTYIELFWLGIMNTKWKMMLSHVKQFRMKNVKTSLKDTQQGCIDFTPKMHFHQKSVKSRHNVDGFFIEDTAFRGHKQTT